VRQVGAGKASESEPVMKCRNALDDIETGQRGLARDEPGGYLPTAQVVSGMKLARARSGLWCGTWEPATRYDSTVHLGLFSHPVDESETPKRQNPQGAE
jgi:hypothetical protein